MRVIADIRPWCEPHRSGVGTYTAEIMKALLRRQANEYALFANGRAVTVPSDVTQALVAANAVRAGRVTLRVSRHPNKLLNASFAFARRPLLESPALAGPADAVFLPNFGFFATQLPYVVTVHDLSFVRHPEFFSAKQRLWHALVRPAETLRRAAAVIAVSRHTAQDVMETYGVPAERITVATPAADGQFVPQTPAAVAAVRAKYELGAAPFFLFLGTIEPRKNVSGVIDAFEKLAGTDARLVLAGGFGYRSEEVLRRVTRSAARDRITALGYVDDADKPALYAAATALVYPSFYEGFGMPPLEAMACGTPVIASRTSSLGEVVGDAGLLVDPRRTEEITEAMAAVMHDDRLAATLAERGLARAARFSWDASAEVVQRALTK